MLFVPACSRRPYILSAAALAFVLAATLPVCAETAPAGSPSTPPPAANTDPERLSELEAKLSKTLSGATLEGSFTVSGSDRASKPPQREKYTLGEVKKIAGNIWQFPTRIQYGGKDVTLPIPLPIQWAGDTPVVVVDNVPLPGFGTVSARVLFFDHHYAGYWKHGEHSGNLFGVIHPATEDTPSSTPSSVPSASPPATHPTTNP